jgi:hypothetical protein
VFLRKGLLLQAPSTPSEWRPNPCTHSMGIYYNRPLTNALKRSKFARVGAKSGKDTFEVMSHGSVAFAGNLFLKSAARYSPSRYSRSATMRPLLLRARSPISSHLIQLLEPLGSELVAEALPPAGAFA